jgi:hypothetical protein
VERRTRKLTDEVGTLEPETIEKITVRRDDDGRIFVGDDFDEFGRLRKILVSRVFGPEEGNTGGICDVRILGTLRGELNEGARHI